MTVTENIPEKASCEHMQGEECVPFERRSRYAEKVA
jgi:hypothetical protein